MLTASVSLVGPHAEGVTRPGPVAALKRQLNGHGGVRQNSVYRSVWGRKREHVTSRSKSLYEFGGGGIVAVDFRYSMFPSGDSRSIIFPDRAYGWERDRSDHLPAGKSWLLETKKYDLELACGQIRLSDPATLQHVLATTTVKRPAGVYDGTRTTLHEGSITMGELYKLNPRLRVNDYLDKPTGLYASYAKLPVKWRLWLGADQLVRRCQTRYDEPDSPWNAEDRRVMTADVRFSGWGDAIDIKPPPAELVATRDELVFADDD
ncbi:hypothetical protein AB0J71_23965 [Nonomuraea sp. NPDC049637]|uniref:hypothetical protein n=1 Tax=Nonomuraea sp. NPDC049637 TaxID=3154356 RepID=UPI003436211A